MAAVAQARVDRPLAAVVWTLLSFALFCAGILAVFVVNLVVRVFIDVPHLLEMAEWSIAWGLAAVAGVLIAARIAFGRWLAVGLTAAVTAGAGIVLSATFHVVLQQWTIARFGEMGADYVGLTAGLFAVLLGLATSAFGVLVAPRGAVGWPLACVLLASSLTVVIVAANVPGLADGIDPESWPLAVWLAISGLYAAAVTILSIRQARHPAATPNR